MREQDTTVGFFIGFVVGLVSFALFTLILIGPLAEESGQIEGLEAATPCTVETQGRVVLVGYEKSVFACVQDRHGKLGWRTN